MMSQAVAAMNDVVRMSFIGFDLGLSYSVAELTALR